MSLPTFEQLLFPILLTSLLAAFAYLYKSERERRVEIERQLSEHKYNTYMLVIDLFANMLHGETSAVQDTISQMNELNRKLLIYGSDDVVKVYQKYLAMAVYEDEIKAIDELKHGDREQRNKEFSDAIADILLAIRRDMGNKKTKVKAAKIFFQFSVNISKIGIEEDKIKSR